MADRNTRFRGRRIYVTGAASGIGKRTSQLLTEEGASLALVDVDAEGLQATAAETGGHPIVADLRDGEAAERSVAEAAEALGGMDGILNCAGITKGRFLEDLTPDIWDEVLAVNLTALYRIIRASLPWMRQRRGSSIVNISSNAALHPPGKGGAAYVVSKGGVISLTRILAMELGPDIRVNAICPGVVRTPMTEPILSGQVEGVDPDTFLAAYALNRSADPLELANAIAFLLSDEASYMTGTIMAVDGGRSYH
jgi:NAD(P)-dependent dehydrogenase (short-subunit alcohol dehydrogenase family)